MLLGMLLMAILSFSKTAHWHILYSTQSNCYIAKLPTFFFLSCSPVMVWSLTLLTVTEI